MSTHDKTAILAALTLLLAAAGCQTVEPGVTNRAGTIDAMLEATPDAVVKAAEAAMEDLQLQVVASKASKIDGAIEARTAREQKVSIRVERTGENASVVSIRIGHWGDQATSMMILDKIRATL